MASCNPQLGSNPLNITLKKEQPGVLFFIAQWLLWFSGPTFNPLKIITIILSFYTNGHQGPSELQRCPLWLNYSKRATMPTLDPDPHRHGKHHDFNGFSTEPFEVRHVVFGTFHRFFSLTLQCGFLLLPGLQWFCNKAHVLKTACEDLNLRKKIDNNANNTKTIHYSDMQGTMWMFPKIVVPPNHPF